MTVGTASNPLTTVVVVRATPAAVHSDRTNATPAVPGTDQYVTFLASDTGSVSEDTSVTRAVLPGLAVPHGVDPMDPAPCTSRPNAAAANWAVEAS